MFVADDPSQVAVSVMWRVILSSSKGDAGNMRAVAIAFVLLLEGKVEYSGHITY